ncbi:DUF397 domain-containing protein [Streptomyces sp. NPDC101166]|uniref:DUF397 domain-containing protein n=1 Tax=Streptomyces sp. NPDC101166 TaxID=3366120 RepID=UPI00381A1538
MRKRPRSRPPSRTWRVRTARTSPEPRSMSTAASRPDTRTRPWRPRRAWRTAGTEENLRRTAERVAPTRGATPSVRLIRNSLCPLALHLRSVPRGLHRARGPVTSMVDGSPGGRHHVASRVWLLTAQGGPVAEQVWRKSSRSASGANCLEMARARDGIRIRDSKMAEGPQLPFTSANWSQFLRYVSSSA